MAPLRPCGFYEPAPDNVLGERMCGKPQTHRLWSASESGLQQIDACTKHFLAIFFLAHVLGNYLSYDCLHEKGVHRYES